MKELTDEKIIQFWHESKCHIYRFAKLLREYLAS